MLEHSSIMGLRCRVSIALAAGLLALTPAAPACAQFFTLQGFGGCIDQPTSKNCRDRLDEPKPPLGPETPQPDEPAGDPMATPAPQAGASPAPVPQTNTPEADKKTAPPPRPGTEMPRRGPRPVTLEEIFIHLQAGTVTKEEMDSMERHAETGDPRAIEVLAWCYFTGKGRDLDLVKAWRLYGQAAALNIPNAAKNQTVIFQQMNGAQRNEIASRPALPEQKP